MERKPSNEKEQTNGNGEEVENKKALVKALPNDIYFEKQKLQFCAIQCVNNMIQKKKYTPESFNEICYNLDPDSRINPHKSLFGLGNYDANVLITAFQKEGFDVVWFDARKDIRKEDLTKYEGIDSSVNDLQEDLKALEI